MTVRTDPGRSLTGRQMEIAGLVAEGLTDAQIARRLGISPRTVHAHVLTVYSKTQTGTRTKLTRWVMDSREGARAG